MRPMLRSSSLVLPALAAFAVLGALEGQAAAAAFTVNVNGDLPDAVPGNGICRTALGACSLRAAVMESNALAGADTITIMAAVGTITLTTAGAGENAAATGDLDISDSVTIVGNGVVIDGMGADRIFHVLGGVTGVDVSNVTLQNGDGGLVGGAIYNQGDLELSSCELMANSADHGGAINNIGPGSLVMTGCDVHDNDAIRGGAIYSTTDLVVDTSNVYLNDVSEFGGAFYISTAGALSEITDSYIGENTAVQRGGGIMTTTDLNLVGTTIQGNAAGTLGGGLNVYGGAVVDAFESDFIGNTAGDGGGIYNFWSTLTLRRVGVWANNTTGNGGGINNQGTLDVQRSAVDDNTAAAGAGIHSNTAWADMGLYNVTVSGNAATGSGGGIFVGTSSVADFNNVTVALNTGTSGGLWATGTTTTVNTIIGDNATLGGAPSDCVGSITSNGHNLIEDTLACVIGGPATADIYTASPGLGALAYNGGRTPTHAVLLVSAARNNGDNATCRPVDQRGVGRPLGGVCDIGAFERS